MDAASLFSGRRVVIATKHQKDKVIGPVLKDKLDVHIDVPEGFDSDQFGTFTKDIERMDNQLVTARKKALAAIKLSDADVAISSEGSFGPHPTIPMIQSNLEIVLFIDTKNKLEIKGVYRTQETNFDGKKISSIDGSVKFAKNIGFPEHGIILRKEKDDNSIIIKDIATFDELKKITQELIKSHGQVFLETDMRAHRNPTRMVAIKNAAQELTKNILSTCPSCNTPGFSIEDYEYGLPCSYCDMPTEMPINNIYRCKKCNFSEKVRIDPNKVTANPKYCDFCNP